MDPLAADPATERSERVVEEAELLPKVRGSRTHGVIRYRRGYLAGRATSENFLTIVILRDNLVILRDN